MICNQLGATGDAYVGQGLVWLSDVVAEAVQSAILQCRLASATPAAPDEEDLDLAACLDKQLNSFL